VGVDKLKNKQGYLMDTLPFCQAKAKQTGKRCGNFAVKRRNVCHIHGGKTPKHNSGPKTIQGKMKQIKSSWKHGCRSKEAIKERFLLRKLLKEFKLL
jgi:hypothetical protein